MALNPALRKLVSTAQNKYKGGGGKFAKPKEGKNTYRILAPMDAPWVREAGGQFWADCGVHWIKPSEDGKPIAVVGDSEVVYGTPNPINIAIQAAVDSAHDEASKKLYTSWKSRRTVIVNAIDRDSDEVVQLELTGTTWGNYLELLNVYADEDIDLTDPIEGSDILIMKTGKGLNTEYSVTVSPSPKKIPVTAEQLSKCADLKKMIAENYFRGEEAKALSAIAQIAGVPVPSLGRITASTPTAALTAASAVVEDATVDEVIPDAPDPVEVAAKAKAKADAEAAEAAAIKARKRAALEAQMAALEAADETPTAPAAKLEVSAETVLSDEDTDAILAELDNLTN